MLRPPVPHSFPGSQPRSPASLVPKTVVVPAIASLILGIGSFAYFCFFALSIPSAILAVLLGLFARHNAKRSNTNFGRGMAMAGILIGGLTLLMDGVLLVAAITGLQSDGPTELEKEMKRQTEARQLLDAYKRRTATQPTTKSAIAPAIAPATRPLLDPNQPTEKQTP